MSDTTGAPALLDVLVWVPAIEPSSGATADATSETQVEASARALTAHLIGLGLSAAMDSEARPARVWVLVGGTPPPGLLSQAVAESVALLPVPLADTATERWLSVAAGEAMRISRTGRAVLALLDQSCPERLLERGPVDRAISAVIQTAWQRGDPVKAIIDTLTMAIERGVPIFNAGGHRGCAEIYYAAASVLQARLAEDLYFDDEPDDAPADGDDLTNPGPDDSNSVEDVGEPTADGLRLMDLVAAELHRALCEVDESGCLSGTGPLTRSPPRGQTEIEDIDLDRLAENNVWIEAPYDDDALDEGGSQGESASPAESAGDDDELDAASEQRRLPVTASDAAWLLRHTFDRILIARQVASALRSVDALFTDLRAAGRTLNASLLCDVLRLAISRGAPLFNAGAAAACATLFARAAVGVLNLLPATAEVDRSRALSLARDTLPPLLGDVDARVEEEPASIVWSLRESFELILDAAAEERQWEHDS